MKERCKICSFFERRLSDKHFFDQKVHQNLSLRKLVLVLETMGLKCSKDLISKHIKECMGIQRKEEKGVLERLGEKIQSFWIKEPKLPLECKHELRERRFNTNTEEIEEYCLQCRKVVASYPIERGEKEDSQKNQIIYASLRRRRS